jgi:hypothetical protein
MYLGLIVEIGPVEAIYDCPAHPIRAPCSRRCQRWTQTTAPPSRRCKAIHRTRSTHRGAAHGAKTIHR